MESGKPTVTRSRNHLACVTSGSTTLTVLYMYYWILELLFIFSTWLTSWFPAVTRCLSSPRCDAHGHSLYMWHSHSDVPVLPCIVRMLDVRQMPCVWGRCHGCEADAMCVRQIPCMCIYSCPPTLFMCACDNPLCLHTRMVWWFNDLIPYRQNGLACLTTLLPPPSSSFQSCVSANTYTVWYIVNT